MAACRIRFAQFFIPLCLGAANLLFLQQARAQPAEPVWADTVLAESLINEARTLSRNGDGPAALEKARQALHIYTTLYGNSHVKTAKTGMLVARELRDLYYTREAMALFEQSLTVFETAEDTLSQAKCHYHLGLCCRNLRQYAGARQHFQTAIDLLHRDSSRYASWLTDFQTTLGSLYNDEKNYLAAIPLLEEAKAAYTRDSNLRYVGLVSYHLAGACFGLHDYVRAREHYMTALANLKTVLPPSHAYFADLQAEIGRCYQKSGEPETGLQYLLDATAHYLKYRPDDAHYIGLLQDLGQFYLDEHQYTAAIKELERCRELKEKRFGPQTYYLLGTLRTLGEAYQYTGQFDRAEACYRRSLTIIADSLNNDRQIAYPYYNELAELSLAQGDYTRCLQYCDTAFSIAGFNPEHPENVLPRDYFRDLCQIDGQAFFEQYHQTYDTAALTRAEYFFSLAAETLHREVEEISVNSSREIFYDRDYPVLEQWLEARMALYRVSTTPENVEAAFHVAAQGKAFLLSDAMRRSGALRFAGVPDSILGTELSLREQIVDAEKKLKAPGARNTTQVDSATLTLNRDLSSWREAYDALLRRIEQTYPEYFRLRLLCHDLSATELRRQRLAPGQALLMYSQTGVNLYAFVLTRDTFFVATLPIDTSLDQDLADFRKCLTEYFLAADPEDALYEQNLNHYISLAQSLYARLILPVAAQLPQRVTIIPNGKLCYLPFEALLTTPPKDDANFRTYPFWGCEKAISYIFSPDFLDDSSTRPATRKPAKNWLGLAPFAGDTGSGDLTARGLPDDNFLPLLCSGQEIRTIAALLQGDAWLGAEARPGRFQTEAPRYRILHLATHSRADDRMGDYSYLMASRTGEVLPAKDLYQLSLAADMVVLSACEAGGGQLLRGEGIIGLVRAFTYAGARSVTASLWVANDKSTATLMIDFYRNLRRGMPKDVALQMARAQLLDQSPAEAHPFYWAGFRVYGNIAPLWR